MIRRQQPTDRRIKMTPFPMSSGVSLTPTSFITVTREQPGQGQMTYIGHMYHMNFKVHVVHPGFPGCRKKRRDFPQIGLLGCSNEGYLSKPEKQFPEMKELGSTMNFFMTEAQSLILLLPRFAESCRNVLFLQKNTPQALQANPR